MATRPLDPSPRKPARKPAQKAGEKAAPALVVDAAAHPPLGMPAQTFLTDYWQKRPLLIRNAFPGLQSPLQPEDLAGLACEEGALARLIQHDRARDHYSVRHGPFEESEFPGLPQQDWTLLVQDVDKWDADVAALLPAFSFLPRWRIDDIMVSFAAPGGSVGAHVDQYDVFLLQAQGHRRWQIDARPNPPQGFRADAELKLLREFEPSHDWVLGPGDMLYLPPGVPHHGVAEDACLTFSVGMRAPSAAELMGDYIDTLAADADEALRYNDPDLAPPRDPNEIDAAAMERVVQGLNALRMNDPDRLGDWFGRFITVYRAAGEVSAGGAPAPSRIELDFALQHGATLWRHPWSRMAWRRAHARGRAARLYVSGQEYALPAKDAQALAAAAELDLAGYSALSDTGRACVLELVAGGHYRLGRDDEADDEGYAFGDEEE
ncbi:cupin domain-containing protein [Lysobacter enzymogenes]|uniref:cupin domain-containing protein n=1 Tax=Lysobacter enzymogenes TaxID=69 RepID=UPI000898D640|nr:cupin domain-containing protein [Lysobacter enzymogenes]SDX61674.1 50S ribosomal protein L16 3-hydroxylase [Lysobacter enzymogenes]